MKKILSFILCALMVLAIVPVSVFMVSVSAADAFIEKDYTSVSKIEDPVNSLSATANVKTTGKLNVTHAAGANVVDENGTPITKITVNADITSNKDCTVALYLEDGETLASNVDYLTVRYRYNYKNEARCLVGKNMTALILWSDGSKDMCVSANTIVSGEWAYLNFDFSNMSDKEEGVYIEAVRYYFYNRSNTVTTNTQSSKTESEYLQCKTNHSWSCNIQVSKNDVIEIGSFYYSNTGYYTGEASPDPDPDPTPDPEPVTKYTVTAVSDGTTVDTAEIEEGASYTLPAAQVKDGFEFKGWSDGTTTYAAGAQVAITKDTTFTAVFEEIVAEPATKYQVTVKVDGEIFASAEIEEGSSYTLPAAQTKDGFTFKGWSDGTTTYDAGASVAIVGNTTFTAVFEENAVTPPPAPADERVLYFNDFSSTDKLNEGEYVQPGNTNSAGTCISNGRLFIRTTHGDGKGVWKKDVNVSGAQNDTIYVKARLWTPSTKQSVFIQIAGTAVLSTTYNDLLVVGTSAEYQSSKGITDNGRTGDGYYFTMTITKSTGAATVTVEENGATILTGSFELGPIGDTLSVSFGPVYNCYREVDDLSVETLIIKDKYDITAIANGETVESVQVEEDSAYTLPEAPVRYGYDFLGWTDGENTYATGDKVTVKGPMTFTAIYHIQEGMSVVNVTVVSDSAILATDSIVTGDTYKLPAAPSKEGHNFMGWSDGENTFAAGDKVTISADTTFTAIFVPKVYYNVTVEADGVTVDTTTIEENTTYTLPAAPGKEDHNFKGWSDGTNIYAAGETVTITSETAFTAVFVPKVYHLVTVVSDGITIATASVEEGTKYTLPAALSKDGYKMSGWSDGTNSYKIGANVVIVGPTTFSAIWLELGDSTIIYQNSFTDTDDLNDATQKGSSVGIDNGRAIFYGSDSSWWRKDVNLDNSTGNIVITFKLYPQFLGTYDILAINDVPLLSSYYDWDKTGWPYSAWIKQGLRFGAYDASLEAAPLNECYAGYNDLNNEAIVNVTVNPTTGDAVVKVDYDCGENGKYSFTSETLNVGPCKDAKIKVILGMYTGGKYFRVDDLLVTQADGQPLATNDVVEREVFDFFFDDFDGEVQGNSSLIAYLNNSGTRVNLPDGNVVITGGVTTQVKYPNAFPQDTALLSLDFMIPSFPENPNDNDQITIMTDNFSKQNHICIKYNASLGKWIAGKTDNNLEMKDYAVIEEGVWNHAVILFNRGTYINGEYVGKSEKMGRGNGGQFISIGGSSYGGAHKNVATYYVDNLYLANECFDRDIVKITGYQKSDVVDGKYNVRFVCALPSLFEGQTKVGFDISSPSQGKSWNFETNKAYYSLNANYGTSAITAESLGAQALVAVAIHGIPEELEKVDLVIKPYIIIGEMKIYGATVSMNPAGSNVEYDGLFDTNVLDPELTDIVVDPNGALADKKVVILIGQSNMAGRGNVSTVEKIDDDRLWMYRNGEFIKLAEPVHTDKDEAGTSPGAAFAKAYAETYNEEVVILPMAVGGTSIDQWSPGNNLFNRTIDAARLAMEQGGEVIAILWNQGESDGKTSLTRRYVHRFAEFVDQLYDRLDLDRATVPFIAGQMFYNHPDATDKTDPTQTLYIHSNATNINQHLSAAASKAGMPALYGIADGHYLRNIGDNTHLDAPSTRVYGYRYFNVYQELIGADADKDGNIDYYDFADPLDLPEDQRTIENVAAILDSYLIKE